MLRRGVEAGIARAERREQSLDALGIDGIGALDDQRVGSEPRQAPASDPGGRRAGRVARRRRLEHDEHDVAAARGAAERRQVFAAAALERAFAPVDAGGVGAHRPLDGERGMLVAARAPTALRCRPRVSIRPSTTGPTAAINARTATIGGEPAPVPGRESSQRRRQEQRGDERRGRGGEIRDREVVADGVGERAAGGTQHRPGSAGSRAPASPAR